jgi:hypothetical protein
MMGMGLWDGLRHPVNDRCLGFWGATGFIFAGVSVCWVSRLAEIYPFALDGT